MPSKSLLFPVTLTTALLVGCASTQEDLGAMRLGMEKYEAAVRQVDQETKDWHENWADQLRAVSIGEVEQATQHELEKAAKDGLTVEEVEKIRKQAETLRAQRLKWVDDALRGTQNSEAKQARDQLWRYLREWLDARITTEEKLWEIRRNVESFKGGE